MRRALVLCLVLLASVVQAQVAPPEFSDLFARPACSRPTPSSLVCSPSPLNLTDSAERYAISEAVTGSPGRELAYLILLNLDTVSPRLVQVDFLLTDRTTTWRLVKWIEPLGRITIPLHMDPLFARRIVAFSLTATFENAGSTTLVTRPAVDLWAAETIVPGVRISTITTGQ